MLKDREVVLFPDLGAYDKWLHKVNTLSLYSLCVLSDFLEKNATIEERNAGMDLADYLIRIPQTSFNREVVEISINDIERCLGSTKTGKGFGEIIIGGIKLKNGKVYDILFTKEGEFIVQGQMKEYVEKLAKFFCKKLIPISFDGILVWGHLDQNT